MVEKIKFGWRYSMLLAKKITNGSSTFHEPHGGLVSSRDLIGITKNALSKAIGRNLVRYRVLHE